MPNPIVEVAEATLHVAHATDPGRTGKNNEDNYALFVSQQRLHDGEDGLMPALVAVVADGIGGSVSGEIASQMAIDAFVASFKEDVDGNVHERLESAIFYANQAIHNVGRTNPEMKGMGTTIVAAAVIDNFLYLAHAGDSRAYLIRDEQLFLLTLDHSWVQEALDANVLTLEKAKIHPNRNVIKRFLGPLERVEVDHTILAVENRVESEDMRLPQFRQLADADRLALRPNDILLLCSDGLNDAISDEKIRQTVVRYPLPEATKQLIHAANAEGGPDNITVVLVEMSDAVASPPLAATEFASPVLNSEETGGQTQLWTPTAPLRDELNSRTMPITPSTSRKSGRLLVVALSLLAVLAVVTLLWGQFAFRAPENVASTSNTNLTTQTPTRAQNLAAQDSTTSAETATSELDRPTSNATSDGTSQIVSSASQPGIHVEELPAEELSTEENAASTSTQTAPTRDTANTTISNTVPSTVTLTLTVSPTLNASQPLSVGAVLSEVLPIVAATSALDVGEAGAEGLANATATRLIPTSTPALPPTPTPVPVLPTITPTPLNGENALPVQLTLTPVLSPTFIVSATLVPPILTPTITVTPTVTITPTGTLTPTVALAPQESLVW